MVLRFRGGCVHYRRATGGAPRDESPDAAITSALPVLRSSVPGEGVGEVTAAV